MYQSSFSANTQLSSPRRSRVSRSVVAITFTSTFQEHAHYILHHRSVLKMTNNNVGTVYQQVIADVVESSRVDFEEGGVDERVLEELRLVSSPFLPPTSLSISLIPLLHLSPFSCVFSAFSYRFRGVGVIWRGRLPALLRRSLRSLGSDSQILAGGRRRLFGCSIYTHATPSARSPDTLGCLREMMLSRG